MEVLNEARALCRQDAPLRQRLRTLKDCAEALEALPSSIDWLLEQLAQLHPESPAGVALVLELAVRWVRAVPAAALGELQVAPGLLREEEVVRAVNFLRNPTVAEPFEQKRAFLIEKTLTLNEISEACRRIGIEADSRPDVVRNAVEFHRNPGVQDRSLADREAYLANQGLSRSELLETRRQLWGLEHEDGAFTKEAVDAQLSQAIVVAVKLLRDEGALAATEVGTLAVALLAAALSKLERTNIGDGADVGEALALVMQSVDSGDDDRAHAVLLEAALADEALSKTARSELIHSIAELAANQAHLESQFASLEPVKSLSKDNPALSRDSQISAAVSFLRNPTVEDKSVEERAAFLRGKGLAMESIVEACNRVGLEPPLSSQAQIPSHEELNTIPKMTERICFAMSRIPLLCHPSIVTRFETAALVGSAFRRSLLPIASMSSTGIHTTNDFIRNLAEKVSTAGRDPQDYEDCVFVAPAVVAGLWCGAELDGFSGRGLGAEECPTVDCATLEETLSRCVQRFSDGSSDLGSMVCAASVLHADAVIAEWGLDHFCVTAEALFSVSLGSALLQRRCQGASFPTRKVDPQIIGLRRAHLKSEVFRIAAPLAGNMVRRLEAMTDELLRVTLSDNEAERSFDSGRLSNEGAKSHGAVTEPFHSRFESDSSRTMRNRCAGVVRWLAQRVHVHAQRTANACTHLPEVAEWVRLRVEEKADGEDQEQPSDGDEHLATAPSYSAPESATLSDEVASQLTKLLQTTYLSVVVIGGAVSTRPPEWCGPDAALQWIDALGHLAFCAVPGVPEANEFQEWLEFMLKWEDSKPAKRRSSGEAPAESAIDFRRIDATSTRLLSLLEDMLSTSGEMSGESGMSKPWIFWCRAEHWLYTSRDVLQPLLVKCGECPPLGTSPDTEAAVPRSVRRLVSLLLEACRSHHKALNVTAHRWLVRCVAPTSGSVGSLAASGSGNDKAPPVPPLRLAIVPRYLEESIASHPSATSTERLAFAVGGVMTALGRDPHPLAPPIALTAFRNLSTAASSALRATVAEYHENEPTKARPMPKSKGNIERAEVLVTLSFTALKAVALPVLPLALDSARGLIDLADALFIARPLSKPEIIECVEDDDAKETSSAGEVVLSEVETSRPKLSGEALRGTLFGVISRTEDNTRRTLLAKWYMASIGHKARPKL